MDSALGKVKSTYKEAHLAGAHPSFCCMKRVQVFFSLRDGMTVHPGVIPSIKFADTHLNTWVERGIGLVKFHPHLSHG